MDGKEIPELARSAADSVFRYVRQSAETVNGGVRWQTLNGENQLYYHPSVYDGVAGICLFLTDYFGITQDEEANTLALDGLEWCSLPEHDLSAELYFGWTGVALAWLRLASVTGDMRLVAKTDPALDELLQRDPGPVADIMGGAAGIGLYLLRLWEATDDGRILQGALRQGEWLCENATRNERGCYWPVETAPSQLLEYTGFGHGISGIAYFLLLLSEATDDPSWSDLAREVLDTLAREATPSLGGVNWPPIPGGHELMRCQWCHGSPGVGLTYVKAYEMTREPDCLETAKAAAETTFAFGDKIGNPSQCHGLSGNAQIFLELYRVTEEPMWLDRATEFARHAMAYRTEDADGDQWQADEPGLYSPDFMCGAAGTGHFFLQLCAQNPTLRSPLS